MSFDSYQKFAFVFLVKTVQWSFPFNSFWIPCRVLISYLCMTLGFFSKRSLVQWLGGLWGSLRPAAGQLSDPGQAPVCSVHSLPSVAFRPVLKRFFVIPFQPPPGKSLPPVFKISHSTDFEEDLPFKKWGARTRNAGEKSKCFSELLDVDVNFFLGVLKDQLMPSFDTHRDWKLGFISEMHVYIFFILNTQRENIMNPMV